MEVLFRDILLADNYFFNSDLMKIDSYYESLIMSAKSYDFVNFKFILNSMMSTGLREYCIGYNIAYTDEEIFDFIKFEILIGGKKEEYKK